MAQEANSDDSKVICVIGDEDTVTGFLLAGVGQKDGKGSNFLVVGASAYSLCTAQCSVCSSVALPCAPLPPPYLAASLPLTLPPAPLRPVLARCCCCCPTPPLPPLRRDHP